MKRSKLSIPFAITFIALIGGLIAVFALTGGDKTVAPIVNLGHESGNPANLASADSAREPAATQTTVQQQSNERDTSEHGTSANLPDQPPPARDDDLFIEAYVRRFGALADAQDWSALERHVCESIRKAPTLKDFLPVLLASLEGLKGDGNGYNPVGRGVQVGLSAHPQIASVADELNTAFMNTTTHVVRVGLAGPLTFANRGRNNVSLRVHIESILARKKQFAEELSELEQSALWDQLIGAHTTLGNSILETMTFVDSLHRSGNISDIELRLFWSDVCPPAFHGKLYTLGDVPGIVQHMIEHTDHSVKSHSASEREIGRLRRIWEHFREHYAYETALRHAEDSKEQTVKDTYEQILAHWLSKSKD